MGKKYALMNCNVIDGNTNSPVKNNSTILIDSNGMICDIGKTESTNIPLDYEIIDLKSRYVMPGLINAHVHLFSNGKPLKAADNENKQKLINKIINTKVGKYTLKSIMKSNALSALNSGVTTLRCVGDLLYKDTEIRNEINSNKYIGPNLIVSGHMISVTGGHGAPYLSLMCDSPWEGRKCVRKNVKNQVDLIKICVTGGVTDAMGIGEAGRLQMTEEEISAICDEAHKVGLLVAAHVESKEGMRIALRGGVDTIEHGSYMDDEIISLFKNNPRSLRGYSALIPTLQAAIPIHKLDKSITGVNQVVKENSAIVYNGMIDGLKRAIDNDIRVGLGTDASMVYVTHYNTWRELDYLIRYGGITAEQAIFYATKSNAEIIGVDNYTGSIEAGKYADLLVLNGNPIKNIRELESPFMVVKKGHVIVNNKVKKIKEIDELLDSI